MRRTRKVTSAGLPSADTNEIIRELKWLSDHAYGYHVGNLVVGIPVSNFENLMDEAAKRLEESHDGK